MLELTFASAAALWDAAVVEAATVYRMAEQESVDIMGPREDPDALACAALLFETVACRSGAIDDPIISISRSES